MQFQFSAEESVLRQGRAVVINFLKARLHLQSLADLAKQKGGFVWIDEIPYSLQDEALPIILDLHRINPYVGWTLPAHLRRSSENLVLLLSKKVRIRLSPGHLKAPASVAFADPDQIEEQFLSLAKRLLLSDLQHLLMVENSVWIKSIEGFAERQGVSPPNLVPRQLLGSLVSRMGRSVQNLF